MTQDVLILGASGKFGSHAERAFKAAGWTTRIYKRGTDIAKAASGCALIVNGLNPPGYRDWDTEIPRITSLVLDAARASGATVLLPGNVYNFGDQPGPWSARTRQETHTRKGKIRIEMEATYRAAARTGVRTIILRAGDFIDTAPTGNYFDLIIAKPLRKGKISYPGRTDVAHAWAYLPDLARGAVALAERRDSLPAFTDVPFPGWTLTGAELAERIGTAVGSEVRASRMAWWPIRLASPVWRLGRELLEMRYLWDHPHALDGSAFNDLVPGFKPTPMAIAMASALPVDIHPDKTMVAADGLA